MYERTIVCLANSKKPPSGRCIAGKEFLGDRAGHWLRPVSARDTREVSEDERLYEGGLKAQLLDIVTIPLLAHQPLGHQAENHVLDADYYWVKSGVATWDQIRHLEDPFDANFWMYADSTNNGLNDKVIEDDAAKINTSLKLIFVPRLSVRVRREPGYEGRPGRTRVRGHFTYQRAQYLLSVTDPVIEEKYLRRGIGDYHIDNAALCVSLAEVWHGSAFRLIASVITEDMF